MIKRLFLFYYYHYYLHLCQEIYHFLILCLKSGTVVPLNTHIEPIWVQYSNGRSILEPQKSYICISWEPCGPQLCILKLSLFQDYFSFISGTHILVFNFIVIEFYQYGTYMGLIWAKKPIWGPCRTRMG